MLDNHDGELLPTLEVRQQIIRAIRQWNADIVHRRRGPTITIPTTAIPACWCRMRLTWWWCRTSSRTPALRKNPVFLYYEDQFPEARAVSPGCGRIIDDVWNLKIDALDAQVSQFYEWLPWVDGRLEEVPHDPAARKEWLSRTRAGHITPDVRQALERRYAAAAAQVHHAESFELCEYGRRPTREELEAIFPK